MGEIIPDALQPAAWLEVVSFITGTAGALFILGAYVALLRGAMKETSRVYHAMNFVGGMLAAVGALVEALTGSFGSCPLVFLEGVWGAVAGRELLLTYTSPGHGEGDAEVLDGGLSVEAEEHDVIPRMFSGSRSPHRRSVDSTPYGSVNSRDGGHALAASLLRHH